MIEDPLATHLFQGPTHLHRRPAGPGRLPVAGEEQQERVTAELDQLTAVARGDPEQGHEAPVDGLGQRLGPDLPVFCQSLRELGETGDVDEGHRSLDDPVPTQAADFPVGQKGGEIARQMSLIAE